MNQASVVYYDKLFRDTFEQNLNPDVLSGLTLFPVPEKRDSFCIFAYDADPKKVITLDEYYDYIRMTDIMPDCFPTDKMEEVVKALALKAVGAYTALLQQAKAQKTLGVVDVRRNKNLTLNICKVEAPSMFDPAQLVSGWLSYRFVFAACPVWWVPESK